jgi:hypothetical protein
MFFWQAFEASHLPALMTVLRNEGRWNRSNQSTQTGAWFYTTKTRRPV